MFYYSTEVSLVFSNSLRPLCFVIPSSVSVLSLWSSQSAFFRRRVGVVLTAHKAGSSRAAKLEWTIVWAMLMNSCLHHVKVGVRGEGKERASYPLTVIGLCAVFTISMIKGGEDAA
jgi:hypothetical protein